MPRPSPVKKGAAKSKARTKPSRSPVSARNKKVAKKIRSGVTLKESSSASAKRAKLGSAKGRANRTSRQLSPSVKTPTILKSPSKKDKIRTASVKQYEAAVKSLYSHEYERAKVAFERILESFGEDKEILERVRMHLRLCEQKMARKPPVPKTMDEYYDFGVALMNEGKYEEATEYLNKALKSNPTSDYVIYALAAMKARIGDVESALNHLQTAINLKPENRFLAQRDADFESLKQNDRFVSLVFPERSISPAQ